jgi:putative transposase
LVDWCTAHGVAIHDTQPDRPDQNAYVERFNRGYRTEALNACLFDSVAGLRALTDTWLRIYNGERPHDCLG